MGVTPAAPSSPASAPPDRSTAAGALDPLAVGLEERVTALWWLISRNAPSDLSRSAAATLGRLREDGPQRIGALAAGESVTQPTMTCVIQRLERDELVQRSPDPEDARATRISITPAGIDALDQRATQRATVLAPHLGRLSTQERRALADALDAIDTLMTEAGSR
jgi:DNA-binding MarR family transcriptional regulator